MIFKDALVLSFFLDEQDLTETEAAGQLQHAVDQALRSGNVGILEQTHYNTKGGFYEWTLAGHDAMQLLAQIRPLVAAADFLVGPKAILIIRQAGSAKVEIRHIAL